MKVTSKGQVTIPAGIREQTGLLPDTEVEFAVSGRKVLIQKAPGRRRRGKKIVSHMRGRATGKLSTDEILALTRGD